MGSDSHDSHDTHAKDETAAALKLALGAFKILDGPVTFFRERIVEPLRAKNRPTYYHRQYNRVPTVDQCEVTDYVCIHEATEQMHRDRRVDKEITQILQARVEECAYNYGNFDAVYKCQDLKKDLDEALTNYFIKYGEIGAGATAIDVYMRQKHRLIWQRRNPDKDIFGINTGSAGKQKRAEEAISRVYATDKF